MDTKNVSNSLSRKALDKYEVLHSKTAITGKRK